MALNAALRCIVGYAGSWVAGWFLFSLDHAPRADARLWFFVRQGALGSQSSFASCNVGSYSVFKAMMPNAVVRYAASAQPCVAILDLCTPALRQLHKRLLAVN